MNLFLIDDLQESVNAARIEGNIKNGHLPRELRFALLLGLISKQARMSVHVEAMLCHYLRCGHDLSESAHSYATAIIAAATKQLLHEKREHLNSF